MPHLDVLIAPLKGALARVDEGLIEISNTGVAWYRSPTTPQPSCPPVPAVCVFLSWIGSGFPLARSKARLNFHLVASLGQSDPQFSRQVSQI